VETVRDATVPDLRVHDEGERPAELRELAGDYAIAGELGRGSSAVVYLARDRALDRHVAIKLVRAVHADDELLERTAQEARLLARLPHHPNIVAIYAVRRLSRRGLALVMQHVAGPTLRQVLARDGALPVEPAVRLLRDLARALHFAHGHGIVHRDVKPENVYVEAASGRALLSDFGAAVSLHTNPRLTAAGGVVGTPAYMSPEQLAGERVDGRSDVNSLGLVAWEMLSGRFPWGTANLYEILYRQRHTDLPRLDELRRDLPVPVVNAVEGALERDRERRWPDAAAFLAALLAPPDAPRLPLREVRAPAAVTLPTVGVDEQHAHTPPLPAPAASRVAEVDVLHDPGAHLELPDHVPHVPRVPDHVPAGAGAGAPLAAPAVAAVADDVTGGAVDEARAGLVPEAPDAEGPDEAAARESHWTGARRRRRVPDRRRLLGMAAGVLVLAVAGVGAVALAGRDDAGAPARSAAGEVSLEQDLVDDLARAAASAVPAAGPAAPADPGDPPPLVDPPPATPPAAPRTAAPRAPAPRPAPSRPAASGADVDRRCATPGLADQRACLLGRLTDYDAELNRVYATLVGELRRQAGVGAGAPDPMLVQRLRQAQRQWLVDRDQRCQRFLRGREGPLWAEERARCLGAVGGERVAQLERELARLRR
jgi:uncharacterized protein YecT (DUF1311 family)/tRNA A-37 threonylcarbamoyl transferase component Bud32